MSISHNKKRNSALLFEFLTLEVSKSLVTGNERRAKVALKIIEKYFKAGTDIFKEYRIARALLMTKGINERVASSIICESKEAIVTLDVGKINESKRRIVRDIHYKLGDGVLDNVVTDYRMYATVHQLFELWRKSDSLLESSDISTQAVLESTLVSWLTESVIDGDDVDESPMFEHGPGVRRLIIKRMTDKLNKKYSTRLTEGQRRLIKTYALEKGTDKFKDTLTKVRDEARELALEWIETNDDSHTSEKLKKVVDLMESEDYSDVDGNVVVRHLSYTSLIDEFRSGE